MNKILLAAFLLLTNLLHSQFKGTLITKENDTLQVRIKFEADLLDVNKLMSLQDGIITYRNNEKKTYLPEDLKSFTIDINYQLVTFDNINDSCFAERLYSNKVRLNKFIKKISQSLTMRYYTIKRPNKPIETVIPAKGLSNLITKNALLKEIGDCQISYDKISNDEFKIKDEEHLIEFVKDFEKNCYSE